MPRSSPIKDFPQWTLEERLSCQACEVEELALFVGKCLCNNKAIACNAAATISWSRTPKDLDMKWTEMVEASV